MNLIEILEKHYQSFINQERDWNFFCSLADYVEFINQNFETKHFLDKIEKDKKKYTKTISKLEKEAVAELQEVKKKILEIVKKEKFTFDGLQEVLQKLEDYEKGNIDPTHYKSSRLDKGLQNLIKLLCKQKIKEFVENYPEFVENSLSLKPPLSKKLLARMDKSAELHQKSKLEMWGMYEKLQLVCTIILHSEKISNNAKEELKEMIIIQNDGKSPYAPLSSLLVQPKFSSDTDGGIKEFKKSNYELYATRIHNYLIKKLSKAQSQDELPVGDTPDFFEVKVKDREIWINNYLIGKPHAVGRNFEFLYYISRQEANTNIKREDLPKLLKDEIKDKNFIKILTDIGFKGEVRKVFFYKVSKDSLYYRGNKVIKKKIDKLNINTKLLIKELDLAHTKYKSSV